jgi:hypothetical protein
VTEMLLARQGRRAGVLETALARGAAADAREAREQAASAPDPDERAANFLAAGYQPGLLQQLLQRLGDVQAELETEREKLEAGARRQERIAREHAAGRITGLDIFRMQDFDEGDSHRCEQLERRAAGIKRQILEASQAISPPQARAPGPVEEASARARRTLAEVTAQVAEARRLEDEADARARAQLKRERAQHFAAWRGAFPRSQPAAVLEAHSSRAGGPEPGAGPLSVPWSRVAGWLARGWRP